MPVRRIPIGRRSLTGAHNWDARALGVSFESSLERDFITLMLFDPSVISIEEQPIAVHYTFEGARRRYIPDFLVLFLNGYTRLIEIKFANDLEAKADEFLPKFDAARKYASERGWRFEVWSEKEIRTVRLRNAKFLLPFTRDEPDAGLAARLIRFFEARSSKEISFVDALNECWTDQKERNRGRYTLWSLLARRRLIADFDHPLNDNTTLRLAPGAADA